jgi:hypothetical protein
VLKNVKNLLICLLLVGVAGCNHESEPKPLWAEDTTDPEMEKHVSAFESAFVLEPTCRGLHFQRKSLVPAPKKYWSVEYYDRGGDSRKFLTTLPKGFEAAPLYLLTADAKEAANKACFVVKGQGGSQ